MSASRLWDCPIELSKKEKFICSKLKNSGKLFVFLREQRHRIFDEHMEQKLLKLYADHPAGKPPVPAALQHAGHELQHDSTQKYKLDDAWLRHAKPTYARPTVALAILPALKPAAYWEA